jgi:hypothetical protein
MSKIHFISFGQSGYYYNLARNLADKFINSSYDIEASVYDESSLSYKLRDFAIKNKTGFGYWKWKPNILLLELEKIKTGDVLIYLDGRFNYRGGSIEWLDEFIFNQEYDFALWDTGYRENLFSSESQINRVPNLEKRDLVSGQIAGGLIVLRKSAIVTKMLIEWKSLLEDDYLLFTNEIPHESIVGNENIQTRSDQSALSLLVKSYKREIRILLMNTDSIYSNGTINPQYYYKKSIISNIANYLKENKPILHNIFINPIRLINRILKMIGFRITK